MPDPHSSEIVSHRIDGRWTGFLWFSWLFIASFYFVGASVSVDFGNRSISFMTALGTIRWQKFFEILHEGREVLIVYASMLICLLYTARRSVKFRLGITILGFVLPIILLGSSLQWIALISSAPLNFLWMIGGIADGEFYVEDMPQYGAIAIWMWVCLLFMGREGYSFLKSRYSGDGSSKPHIG